MKVVDQKTGEDIAKRESPEPAAEVGSSAGGS